MTTGFSKVKVTGGFLGCHCKSIINCFLLSASTAAVSFSTKSPWKSLPMDQNGKGK